MHRTQVLLDEQQYQAIRSRAEREGKSMGALIREFVQAGLQAARGKKREKHRLEDLQGLFSDATLQGRDHDQYLYGKR